MAVPDGRNGMAGENGENGGLFEEEQDQFDEEEEEEYDTPPHLRDLLTAAETGDLPALTSALDDLNGSVNEPLEDGDTALHLTCLYGYLPCVQLLLQRGASLEAKDEDGAIPLHDACAGGFTSIVQLLIDSADPECLKRMLEAVDVEGDTPLHHAARGEHVDVIQLLLSAGASPTVKNIYGKPPSELADSGTEARTILAEAECAMT